MGDPSNVSRVDLDIHCRTHVEGSLNFLAAGGTLDEMSLDTVVGPVWVTDLGHVDRITARDLDDAAIHRGPFELSCLPIAIAGAEAAPVRAVLRSRETST